jgi:hypothetical protein
MTIHQILHNLDPKMMINDGISYSELLDRLIRTVL